MRLLPNKRYILKVVKMISEESFDESVDVVLYFNVYSVMNLMWYILYLFVIVM